MFFDAVKLIAKLSRQQIREVSITKRQISWLIGAMMRSRNVIRDNPSFWQRKCDVCILSDRRRQEHLQSKYEWHICLARSQLPDIGKSSSPAHRVWLRSNGALPDYIALPRRWPEPEKSICTKRVRSSKAEEIEKHTIAGNNKSKERLFKRCTWGICETFVCKWTRQRSKCWKFWWLVDRPWRGKQTGWPASFEWGKV